MTRSHSHQNTSFHFRLFFLILLLLLFFVFIELSWAFIFFLGFQQSFFLLCLILLKENIYIYRSLLCAIPALSSSVLLLFRSLLFFRGFRSFLSVLLPNFFFISVSLLCTYNTVSKGILPFEKWFFYRLFFKWIYLNGEMKRENWR